MGLARLDWRDIPVREACDTKHMPVGIGPLQDPVGTNMGNPHATFFVDNAAAIPLDELGPKLEHDRFFPERANIGSPSSWARAGCGCESRSAAQALRSPAARALARPSWRRAGRPVPRKADVVLEGGTLTIEWLRDDHVLMTGGIASPSRASSTARCFS